MQTQFEFITQFGFGDSQIYYSKSGDSRDFNSSAWLHLNLQPDPKLKCKSGDSRIYKWMGGELTGLRQEIFEPWA